MIVRFFARLGVALALLVAFSGIAVRPLHAQTTDIIVGTVTDPNGKPVAGAKIDAFSIETEVTRSATTNDKGQYRIVFIDGTGQYRISVKAIGKNPQIFNVNKGTDDDRIVLNIKLGEKPVQLADLNAVAGRRPNADANEGRATAGESVRTLNGGDALRLPIDAGDLAALAALAPGVVATSGTDSTAATFSVAGQSAASNTYVVNGQTTTSSAVPQDGVGRTRVITNSYDVARGNFSGGMVSVTTKGGSNRVTGSLSSGLQDQNLSWGGNTSTAFGAGNGQYAVGGGFGGPLVRDKVFLFGAVNVSRRTAPVPSLDGADVATLGRLGVSPDSASKFNTLVNATGLTQLAGTIPSTRNTDALASVLRFDWNPGQVHSVIFTGQLQLNGVDPQSIGQTSLSQVGGNNTSSQGSGGLRVTSRFDNGLINAFTGGYTVATRNSTAFLPDLPAGRVTNYSPDSLGGVSTTTFGFGGNAGMPTASTTKTVEITNELSYNSGSGTHRYALGLYGNSSSFSSNNTNNQFGTFTYATLADFQNNVASTFTRTLQPAIRTGSVINEAVYLSDAWRPRSGSNNANNGGGAGGPGGGGGGPGGAFGGGGGRGGGGGPGGNGGGNLQVTYGIRVEHSSYTGAPARNDSVFNEFGLDTHVLPSEFYLSPRAGFSYSIAAPEQQGQAQRGFAPPLLTIRGGFGVFRGTMPATLPGTAQAQSGLSNAQTQLLCTGAAVPTANFADYINNPEDIPTECLNNQSTPIITGVPNITGYAPNYGAPKTDRISLGATRRITQRVSFQVDASYVRGVGQGASTDLNLNTNNVRFTLANENNRPVYADPSQIVTSTGQVPLSASRIDPAFGSVTRVFSSLENLTKQVTFTVSGTTAKQVQLNLSYTLMSAQDQGGSGGGFGGGNLTDGNPNNYTWATSSSAHTHNFQASILWPVTPAFEISVTANLLSGTPYTPVVQGDINGDGSSRDDRAYVYNPATTADTGVANGMSRLLASTSGNAKSCLQSQIGQIAGRNTCYGPWTATLNPQINYRPALFDRRLQLQFRASNLLGGLDELINGDNNIKGWGGTARPDNTLLTVTGFNTATNQFNYSVNSRFGNTSSSATAIRQPFQIYLGMTYAIGYDPRTAAIQNLSRQMGGATTGLAMLDTVEVRFRRQSVATAALARKDSLVLSKEQVTALEALVDSSNRTLKVTIDSIRPTVATVNLAGSAGDANGLMAKIIPFTTSLTNQQRAVHDAVQKILTDVQWALLPDSAKNPPNQFFPTGRGGGPAGPGGAGGAGGGAGGGRGGRGGGE